MSLSLRICYIISHLRNSSVLWFSSLRSESCFYGCHSSNNRVLFASYQAEQQTTSPSTRSDYIHLHVRNRFIRTDLDKIQHVGRLNSKWMLHGRKVCTFQWMCYKRGLVFPKTGLFWPKPILRGAVSVFSMLFFCWVEVSGVLLAGVPEVASVRWSCGTCVHTHSLDPQTADWTLPNASLQKPQEYRQTLADNTLFGYY